MSRAPEINADRLCDAATNCLRAHHEAKTLTGKCITPMELWDTDIGERFYRGYLKFEIQEAERFLVRLGMIGRGEA